MGQATPWDNYPKNGIEGHFSGIKINLDKVKIRPNCSNMGRG